MGTILVRRVTTLAGQGVLMAPPVPPVIEELTIIFSHRITTKSSASVILQEPVLPPPEFLTTARLYARRLIFSATGSFLNYDLPVYISSRTAVLTRSGLTSSAASTGRILVRSNVFALSFTATPISGPAPLIVQFQNTSLSPVDVWTWFFGDGHSSTDKHPTHTYTHAGLYSIMLIAGNIFWGQSTLIKYNYILVSAVPGPRARMQLSWTILDEVDVITIPFQNLPAFVQEVELESLLLTLSFYWNSFSQSWLMDVEDIDKVAILRGVHLVIGFDLFKRHNDGRLPGGKLFVIDPSERLDKIQYGDFVGTRGLQLVYIPRSDE
jgi:hypothetical protein